MNYRYSGHETFPCRYTWLPKAVRGLTKNGQLFSDEDAAMVDLGVGKNMVRSIRFWADAAEIASSRIKEPGLDVSEFGKVIFGARGHDQFLEDIQTLWLIHWKFSTNVEQPLFAWHYLLNFWHRPDFSRTEALATLSQEAQRLGKKTFSRYSGSSFHHIPSYLRMRFPAARSRGVRRSLLCLHARPEKNWKTGVGKSVSWSSNLAEGLSRTTGRAILFRRFQSVLAVVTTSDSPVQKVGLCALPNLVFTCFGEPVWMKCSFKYHASRLLFGMIPCSHLRRLTLNGASSMACCTSN